MVVADVTTTTLAQLLSSAGEVATWIFGQVATVGETIVSTPILMVTMGFLLLGGAIGIFGRLLSKN